MIYLTDTERELCKKVQVVQDWGDLTYNEIHRLSGAYCWEIYDKWNGEGLEWVPKTYNHPKEI